MVMFAALLAAALLAAALDIASLQKMAARFAPVEVTADLSGLAPQERGTLAKIVEAARLMDTLYLRQVWARIIRCCWISPRTRRWWTSSRDSPRRTSSGQANRAERCSATRTRSL